MEVLQASMSASPETEFDLEKLFLPAWAQDSANTNRYADFPGEERRERKGDDRHGRPRPRREGGGGGRDDGRPRGGRPDRPQRGDSRGRRPRSHERSEPETKREAPAPLPEINLVLSAEDLGVDSLARQIRMTGRAYPLFDIARLVLQKPERLHARFEVKKNAEGQVLQALVLCALDETLWLSEAEAVEHILRRHFATFYQADRTPTDPPRGTYTFVAQCGMSGAILGPPNYHDYQNQLRKLHAERFSRMPFEAFKSRVKIVKDEATVKKWIEDHSFKTEYTCLNVPEPKKLASREEVEKHFRETHLTNLVRTVESQEMSGTAAQQLQSHGLRRMWRAMMDEQRRFPLKLATSMSQQFASRGLQFFKVNRVTHVSVARPHYLDLEATPVSEGVKRIVDFISANAKCTRRKLVEALAPTPAAPPVAQPVAPAAPAEGEAAVPPAPTVTPEQTALASDLHWLVHQGHVIEFANGVLELAKKPVPRPPKPEKKETPAVETSAAESATTPPAADSSASATPAPETSAIPAESEPAASVESTAPGAIPDLSSEGQS